MIYTSRRNTLASIHRPQPAAPSSLGESILRIAGVDQDVIDEVLGDMAEEYAMRVARVGRARACGWYLHESLRSVPHLGLGALRARAQHQPTHLAALVSVFVVAASLVFIAQVNADGPPAFLTADRRGELVVNSERPVQLSIHVVDAAGHALPSSNVRYQWTSGVPVSVSAGGVITCSQAGDATVRAALGALEARLSLHCRPVHDVRATVMMDVVVGEDARALRFEATDASGQSVTELAGIISIRDSTIATLESQRIHARAPGITSATVSVGDHASFTAVHSYQRVEQLDAIVAGQHLAVRVRLAPREMRRWSIPAGSYFLAIHTHDNEQTRPQLAVAGAVCKAVLEHFECWAREPATVIAYYPRNINHDEPLTGTLTIWRQEE
ncbi:MAG: hypothetical protein JWM95_2166 [Gemmatimonadetes bacterium]|nr:hypothetical protein [Gemmatimonadota bacterium]